MVKELEKEQSITGLKDSAGVFMITVSKRGSFDGHGGGQETSCGQTKNNKTHVESTIS